MLRLQLVHSTPVGNIPVATGVLLVLLKLWAFGFIAAVRIRVLLASVALVCAFACRAAEEVTATPRRPNILWLIAEDFGPHLGCLGTKEV